jgi:hypothetical protein
MLEISLDTSNYHARPLIGTQQPRFNGDQPLAFKIASKVMTGRPTTYETQIRHKETRLAQLYPQHPRHLYQHVVEAVMIWDLTAGPARHRPRDPSGHHKRPQRLA